MTDEHARKIKERNANKQAASEMTSAPEISDLGWLSSEEKIIDALREIAAVFGKTVSVSSVPQPDEEASQYVFLIHFEQSKDAMAAAKAMKCAVQNGSTLLVPIPRPQSGGTNVAPPVSH